MAKRNENRSLGEAFNRLVDLLILLLPDLNSEQRKNLAKLTFSVILYGALLRFTLPLVVNFRFWGSPFLVVMLVLLGAWQVVLKGYFQCQEIFDRDIFRD
jgi:hypothetical protein